MSHPKAIASQYQALEAMKVLLEKSRKNLQKSTNRTVQTKIHRTENFLTIMWSSNCGIPFLSYSSLLTGSLRTAEKENIIQIIYTNNAASLYNWQEPLAQFEGAQCHFDDDDDDRFYKLEVTPIREWSHRRSCLQTTCSYWKLNHQKKRKASDIKWKYH